MKIRKSMIILSQRLIVIMLGTTLFACGNKQAGHQAGVPEAGAGERRPLSLQAGLSPSWQLLRVCDAASGPSGSSAHVYVGHGERADSSRSYAWMRVRS